MVYIQYFHKDAVSGNDIPACGDRAVVILDGRQTLGTWHRDAVKFNGYRRPAYTAYQIMHGDQPDVLYHLSRRTNRNSIKSKGLVPQIKEYKDIPREPGVFFFQTLEQALDYGGYHAQYINQAVDIWECQIPEEYDIERDPHPEMDFTDAWKSKQTLAPENFRFLRTILVPTSKTEAPLKSTKMGSEPTIEKLKREDIPAMLVVGAECFPQYSGIFEGIVRSELDGNFSNSYVAKLDGKIVGGYLLGDRSVSDVSDRPEALAYEGKKGIEGVALFVLPQYRGTGLGKRLRALPLSMGADYIWGQHFEDLNNLQNWVNFGRRLLFTEGGIHFTIMDMKPDGKTADHDTEEGYWAGEGNAASGILPVNPQTGNVCLAWRSRYVQSPNCWGTIGGAIQRGLSPAQSAKVELAEETGYSGGINLIPAFTFSSGEGFQYHNFIGVTSTEFSFAPKPFSEEHIEELKTQLGPKQMYQLEPGWETDYIQWVPYAEVVADMKKHPSHYHSGLLALFRNSRKQIEKALGIKPEPMKTAAQTLAQYLKLVSPNIARHAQQIYDAWDQNEEGVDEELGEGGICDAISEEIIDLVISAQPFPLNATEGGQEGDDHSWVVVYTDTEVYGVDISHSLYERGGGYSWKKVPGVQFEASDVEIWKLDIWH